MSTGTRRDTLLLYWGSIATGVLLPLGTDIVAATTRRTQTLGQYLDGFLVRMFAPGEGVLMLTALGGAPFVLFAVLALLHLGTADRHGAELAARRRLALSLAYAAMLAPSLLGHYAILTSRGSTAGLGFLFLPFLVVAAGVAAYVLGRGITRLRRGPLG